MLHVSVLGDRTVVDDAGQVRTRSARTMALIAYLASRAGMPQPRAVIAGAFWPDTPDAQSLTNLRRELHGLRRVLGDGGPLVVTPGDLAWRDHASCRVDLRVFALARHAALHAQGAGELLEHGATALVAYRGELLPGVYDEWTLARREELTAQCVELCGLVSRAARDLGRWSAALDAARRRVALAPLDEAGYRELMSLQAHLGDRAGAMSTYHRCASVLDRELGLEPDPRTRALVDTLLREQQPGDATSETIRDVVPPVDFVGREAELRHLVAAFETAARGSTTAVLVTGEPGVGKSRLVAEAAREARRRGAAVAVAHCYGMAGRLALSPVAEWLNDPAVARDPELLPPVWQAEIDRLRPGDTPKPGVRGLVDAWQRHRFFQALAHALRPTGRPVLLVLEDLQWCDEETVDFLTFLLSGARDEPMMVALTGRAQELASDPAHAEWVRRARASGVLRELPLAPLGAEETARLVRLVGRREVPDGEVELLQSATGGFPLHLVEATRPGTGPGRAPLPDLDAVLRARFEQVGAEARAVAGLAAATGRDFDLELLCEASDLPADAVVRAVDELWRLRIVHELRSGYDFSHDLLRDAAYELVTPPARWLLHRRLAQALEVLHGDRTDGVAAQLAEQHSRAGNAARAYHYYRRAAAVAAGVFAHAEAVRHDRQALALLAGLPPGAERDLEEIQCLRSMSLSLTAQRGYADPELADALERMVLLAEQHGLGEPLVDGLVSLWSSVFVRGDITRAHEIATRAMARSDSGHASFAVAGSTLSLGRPRVAIEHFDVCTRRSADEESLSTGSHPAIHGRAWSAHAHWLLGRPDRAEECAREAVDRARAVRHPYSLAIALAYAAVTHQMLDHPESLQQATSELARLSSRHGFAYYREWGLILSGWAGHDAATMDRGLAGLRAIGAQTRMPYWLALRVEREPDDARARALLDAAVVGARARGDRWWLPEVLRVRAVRSLPAADRTSALYAALALAEMQGSRALAERCRRSLAAMRTVGERSPS